MFTKTLSQNATAALALLGKSGIFNDAYLAGGTACALQPEKWTILGSFPKVKFSYFYYQYPLIKKTAIFSEINIASLEDIAAMKIAAICDRGTKRDFIDMYFLAQKFSMDTILKLYDKKYGKLSNNLYHILKSLTYFNDADSQNSPKMIKKISWEKVRDFFQKQAIKLAKSKFKI